MTPEGQPLPAVTLTMDQLVAINMRRWRIAAGSTQEELGKLLGWSGAVVSAAERSADPARDRRRFDAQALADIATALGVPLIALFLPPSDDGLSARYLITTSAGRELGMGEYMDDVVMHDSGARTPAMSAYMEALLGAVDQYLDPEWAQHVSQWLAGDSPQLRAERARRLRERAGELSRASASAARAAADFSALADEIEAPG